MNIKKQNLPVAVSSSATIGFVGTIGGIIVGGKIISDQIKGIIDKTGAEVREILRQVDESVNEIIKNLEATYQKNLNITIDSLDAFTRNKLLELEQTFRSINQGIQETIDYASDRFKEIMSAARLEVQRVILDLESSFKNVIIVAGETAVYVLDRATYNAVFVVSVVFLGIGLLVFSGFLFKRGLPSGFGGVIVLILMLLFLAFFGVLALVPKIRGKMMSFTGIGLKARLKDFDDKPRILDVIPGKIILSQTKELKVWGVSLLPKDKSVTIKIDTILIAIKATSPELIVAELSNFTFPKPDGSYNLLLYYDGVEGLRGIIEVGRPAPPPQKPNLIVSDFYIQPNPPIQNQIVKVVVSIQNQGPGDASGDVDLAWQPRSTDVGHVEKRSIRGLKAGQKQDLEFAHTYLDPGVMQSVVTVDPEHKISETVELDNIRKITFDVQPAPPPERKVILFEHRDWMGKQKEIAEDIPSTSAIGMPDMISSIKLVGGLTIIAYEHASYGGRAIYVDKDINSDELGAMGFHDNISSIKVFQQALRGITVFEHTNFIGKSTFITNSVNDTHILGFKDNISSIKLHGQARAIVYEHTNFQGKNALVESSIAHTGDIEMHDSISSIEIS